MTTDSEPVTHSDSQPEPQPQSDIHLPFPLQPDERVIAVVRRHWWFLWPYTAWLAVVAIGGPLITYWMLDLIKLDDNVGSWFWIPALIWMAFWGVRFALNWYRYQNDIWVVTDQRIIDSLKPNPLRHVLSTADLVNIQDMSVEKRGVMANVFGFGDVHCDTAASGRRRGQFILSGIPKPAEVQLMVDAERDRARARNR